MARPWSEVESSQAYRSLAPEQQAVAKRQYFEQVVAPRVPKEQVNIAWTQFSGEQPQGPSIGAQALERAGRAGEAFLTGTAAPGRLLSGAFGESPYSGGLEGAGQVAGDVGSTLLAGLHPGRFLAGLGAGAALEGAAGDYIRQASEAAGRGAQQFVPRFLEESPSPWLNIPAQMPGAVMETLTEFAPAFLLGMRASKPKVGPVPVGQEAAALLRAEQGKIPGQFKAPKVGAGAELAAEAELTQALQAANRPLGKAVGTVKESVQRKVADFGTAKADALSGLEKLLDESGVASTVKDGVKTYRVQSASDPQVARIVNNVLREARQANDVQALMNQVERLKSDVQRSFKTQQISNTKAPMLIEAENALWGAIERQLPERLTKQLQSTRQAFGQNRELQQMVDDSMTNNRFDPAKFANRWKNTLSAADKKRIFTAEQIKAIDGLVNSPSKFKTVLRNFWEVTKDRFPIIGRNTVALEGRKALPAARFFEPMQPRQGVFFGRGTPMGSGGAGFAGAATPFREALQQSGGGF